MRIFWCGFLWCGYLCADFDADFLEDFYWQRDCRESDKESLALA